jgi:transcriptional regulator with XRE-family HTH domain
MEELKTEYFAYFSQKVMELTLERKAQNFTQSYMAHKLGVSIRTIQHFENYRCENYYLIFGYKRILTIFAE